MMKLKEVLTEWTQKFENQSNYVTQRDLSSVHEPAPDIWFEILPLLDQRAEIPPELLQE